MPEGGTEQSMEFFPVLAHEFVVAVFPFTQISVTLVRPSGEFEFANCCGILLDKQVVGESAQILARLSAALSAEFETTRLSE